MKKLIAVLAIAVAMQGCSSKAPSTSEIEKAITANYADCSNLAIENIKVVNGMNVDETTHQVQAQFDLRVIPIPAADVEAATKTVAVYREKQQQTFQLETQWNDAIHKKSQMRFQESEAEMAADPRVAQLDSDIQSFEAQLGHHQQPVETPAPPALACGVRFLHAR